MTRRVLAMLLFAGIIFLVPIDSGGLICVGLQDVEPVIRRLVAGKVAGIVAPATSQKKPEAMDAEAERRAEVVRRHRKEWERIAGLRQEALRLRDEDLTGAFTRAKLAKITAEITAIQQAGERKAWRLDDLPMDAELKISGFRVVPE